MFPRVNGSRRRSAPPFTQRARAMALVAAAITTAFGCVSPEDPNAQADVDGGIDDIAANEQGLVSGTINGTRDLLTELFPEIARAKDVGANSKYSPETCAPVTGTMAMEAITIPASELNPIYTEMGVTSPCPSATATCNTRLYANTLHVGRTLTINDSSNIMGDNFFSTTGAGPTTIQTPGTAGAIVVADDIVFDKEIKLSSGGTYVFVAKNSITFNPGTSLRTSWRNNSVPTGIKVTRKSLGDSKVATTVSGTAGRSAHGEPGANVVLITPKVVGGIYAYLPGSDGTSAEALPELRCDSDKRPGDSHWCNGNNYIYSDWNCWDNVGNNLVGGTPGNGANGGRLLIVSDTAAQITYTDFSGGAAGARALAGTKVWSDCTTAQCSLWSAGDYCSTTLRKSYGTAGPAATAGKPGKQINLALNGKIRDFMYLFGGRAARRDMINARFKSLATDPDSANGDANRDAALAYYDGVLNEFCETALPAAQTARPTTAPHRLLPLTANPSRLSLCMEAQARRAPMAEGLNFLGLPHNLVVYADPAQLQAQRDAYLDAFNTRYAQDFQAAIAAGSDPILSFYDYVVADAKANRTAREGEAAIALRERDSQFQAAKDAWKLMQDNADLIEQVTADNRMLFAELRDAVSPPPAKQGLWDQFSGPITDLFNIAKAGAKLVLDVYTMGTGSLATGTSVYGDYKNLLGQIKSANDLWGTVSGGYDLTIPLETQVATHGVPRIGAAACQGIPSAISKALVQLALMRQEIPSAVKDQKKARILIDVLVHNVDVLDEHARASCGLWQAFAHASQEAVTADQRHVLALGNAKQATQLSTLADTLNANVAAAKNRADLQRDTACREAKFWEEQIMLYDFLAARAQAFATTQEPSTRVAKGDFTWELLWKKDADAYVAENATEGVSFSGWTAASRLRQDYLVSDSECVNGTQDAGRCQAQRSVMGQVLDTGLARLRPEDGPTRFGIHTDHDYGRVTNVSTRLLGPSATLRAGRVWHQGPMKFDNAGVTSRTVFPVAATQDLCEYLQDRNNALRSRLSSALIPQALDCAAVPSRFLIGTDVPTPDIVIWEERDPTWDANTQWNMFGASARGEWIVDFRDTYRELNRLDGCYDALHAASTQQTQLAEAEACLGNAFLDPACATLQDRVQNGDTASVAAADACLADSLLTRVQQFTDECPIADDGVAWYLDGEAPAACDRVCGSQCMELKAQITGMRLDISVRSHSSTL